MQTFNIISSQVGIFESPLTHRPFKTAIEKSIARINLINLREFAIDSYGSIDEKPFGGGIGMVLRPEPIYNALLKIYGNNENLIKSVQNKSTRIIVLDPSGETWSQERVKEFEPEKEITIICGRYEGIDQRIIDLFATDVISIGPFVSSGGELPALLMLESIIRTKVGVLEKSDAAKFESYSVKNYLEHPQYTRPVEFRGLKVPEVLLSGDHSKISDWKKQNQK